MAASSPQTGKHFPYRDATLTITNPANQPVTAVRLRPRDGGPAVQFPLMIPPGGSAERSVYLPALSVSQSYDIDLLAEDAFPARPVGQVQTDIQWPVELLTQDVFLDPAAWQEYSTSPPRWSNTTKLAALFIGIVILLALAGVLLIRRNALRFWTWAVIVTGSLTAVPVWLFVCNEKPLRKIPLADDVSGFLVQTRRTGAYPLPGLSPQFAPVYAHPTEIRDETLMVHPRKGSYLTLQAGETRIFLEKRRHKSRE